MLCSTVLQAARSYRGERCLCPAVPGLAEGECPLAAAAISSSVSTREERLWALQACVHLGKGLLQNSAWSISYSSSKEDTLTKHCVSTQGVPVVLDRSVYCGQVEESNTLIATH